MKLKFSALKIFLILIVLLFSFGFVFAEGEEGEEVILLPAPESALSPSDGDENVEFDINLNLILKWSDVSGASKYICKYWEEDESTPSYEYETISTICECSGDNAIYQNCCLAGREGLTDNGFILSSGNLSPGKKYFWQVKSCDAAGICGDYGSTWSFTLQPNLDITAPGSLSFNNRKMGEVTINWGDVNGANSYILSIRMPDAGCDWYNWIAGFFTGGDCNPWVELFEKALEWIGLGDFVENYDFTCPWKIWDKDTGCNNVPVINKQEGSNSPESSYLDDACIFVKEQKYDVKVAACIDDNAKLCGPFSNTLSFTTEDGGTIPAPEQEEPLYVSGSSLPVVGTKDYLRWKAVNCADYIGLRVWGNGLNISGDFPSQESVDLSGTNLADLFKEENLNKTFSWQVRSCWRVAKTTYCEGNPWSPSWQFKTVGAPPTLLSPINETVSTPITLEWEDIEAAGSYRYQVSSDPNFSSGSIKKEGWTSSSKIKISYTFLDSNTQYWWRIKTCADDKGEACGASWSSASFSTFSLTAPTDPFPKDKGTSTIPVTLKWQPDPGANFYQYKVAYLNMDEEEVLEGCAEKEGMQIIPKQGEEAPITDKNQFFLYSYCLGDYQWTVRSCWDEKCEKASDYSAVWEFKAVQPIPAKWDTGIVPCGRRYNDPNTPYNEREPCQLKHFGFMFQNIIDFLLWRIGLIVLLVLTIVTGLIYYSSLGDTEKILQIKAMWRAAGTGFLIMLLAWTAINLLLAVLGFDVEFFGRWWKIEF